jgi:hypothetical protein
MDPRERADAALARARARGAWVVTPESAISPMDAANTLQLPRIVVTENDERRDPDATLVVPIAEVRDNIPAIAQEALTDVVGSPPGIRSRQRRIEDAIARGASVRQQEPGQAAPQQGQPAVAQPTQPVAVPPAASPAPAAEQPNPAEQPTETNEVDPDPKTPPTGTGGLAERLNG